MTTSSHPVLVHIGTELQHSTLPERCQKTSLDTSILAYDAMTIAEARAFVAEARERPLEAQTKVIVLHARLLSEAVQNTLLKILEEPPATTEIHILIPHVGMLLPTVRSRVQILEPKSSSRQYSDEARQFMSASAAERITNIAAWHKSENDQAGRDVLLAVAHWIQENTDQVAESTRVSFQTVDTWYHLSGASRKMLLEELALSLPVLDVTSQSDGSS